MNFPLLPSGTIVVFVCTFHFAETDRHKQWSQREKFTGTVGDGCGFTALPLHTI